MQQLLSRHVPRLTAALAVLVTALALVPSASSAFGFGHGGPWHGHTYGDTTLELDPATAEALTGLGVTPGVVSPASAGSEGIAFPITRSLPAALLTGTITHTGGLTLTAGETVVSLTEFSIELGSGTLSADVSVAGGPNDGRVKILTLDFSHAQLRWWPVFSFGPVKATLTETAASVLDSVFGTTALTDQTVLGNATVHYTTLGF
jgi:hypothetical protein